MILFWWLVKLQGKKVNHKDTKATKAKSNELSKMIVDAAIEVHRILGPGPLESLWLKQFFPFWRAL